MERAFWEERWASGQTAFHEGAPNALLVQHADRLRVGPGGSPGRVYVPLCGKTRDLAFLRARGHEVLGTEIVPAAIAQLFAEHGAAGEEHLVEAASPFRRHSVGGLTVLEGDAFALEPGHLGGPVDAIFDRAALVAVAPETRGLYVASLTRVLRPGGVLLLVTFDYDQTKVSGPPWAVSNAQVEALFGASYEVTLLEDRAGTGNARFAGAEPRERLFALTRLPAAT